MAFGSGALGGTHSTVAGTISAKRICRECRSTFILTLPEMDDRLSRTARLGAIDISTTYRDAVKACCPNATTIVDTFHGMYPSPADESIAASHSRPAATCGRLSSASDDHSPSGDKTMRHIKGLLVPVLAFCIATEPVFAQEAGNSVYREAGNKSYANQQYGNQNTRPGEPALGDLLYYDHKDLELAPYVEAYVLMNVKADEFIAVFGVAQEGPTSAESNRKVDKLVADLLAGLQPLGVTQSDVFVDFITQNPVYDYNVSGRTARETQSGFQTKKTVAIRYKDREMLEKMIAVAAGLSIYDLIKVDYVVNDLGVVRKRLFEEATRIVRERVDNYGKNLGVAIKPRAVSEEKYNTYYPSSLYRSYTAYEAGSVDYQSTTRVVDKRKTSTSYYDPLQSAKFDLVIDPAGVELTVQCTLYLKVRCTWAQ